MSHKRQGQLTTSGEWAKHVRPFNRHLFWGGERAAERDLIRQELDQLEDDKRSSESQKEVFPTVPRKDMSP